MSPMDSRLDRSIVVLLPVCAVVKECALSPFASSLPMVPDSGYGLLALLLRFDLRLRRGRSPSEEDLKLVSFLTHVANGRRRWPWRS
jgi:hypothetical protein